MRVSQILSVPSSPPLTSHFPSQCHAIDVTLPVCPSNVLSGATFMPRPAASWCEIDVPMHCNHTIARRHDQRLLRASCSAKWRVDSPGSLSTESYESINRTMPPRTESYGRILLSQARRREHRGPKAPSSLMLGSSSALERLTWIVHAKLSYHSLWSSCLFSLGLSLDFTSVLSLPTLLSPATCCQNEWSGWWRNRPSAHTLRSRLPRQHDSTTGLANWRRRAATLPCLASRTLRR